MLFFLYILVGIVVSVLFSLRLFAGQRSAPTQLLAAAAAGCCFLGWVLFWPAVALAWVLEGNQPPTDTQFDDD